MKTDHRQRALAFFSALYVFFGVFVQSPFRIPGLETGIVWLPAGFGVFMVCRYGRRALPWVGGAALLTRFSCASFDLVWWEVALRNTVFALLDVLQALLAWRLWRRGDIGPWSWKQGMLVGYLARGVALPMLLTGWVYVLALLLLRQGMSWQESGITDWIVQLAGMRVISSLLGVFLVVPFLSTLQVLDREHWWLLCKNGWPIVLIPFLLWGSFGLYELVYMMFPLLLWLAFRVGVVGTATAMLTISVSVITLMFFNHEPFVQIVPTHSQSSMSLFILCLGIPTLVLAAIFDEHRTVRGELESKVAERTEALEKVLGELQEASTTDPLTGVYNRRYLTTLAWQEIHRHNRYHQPASLVMLDIDNLRTVNESHGHEIGDALLASVARLAATTIRKTDYLGRWGDGVFVIVAPNSVDNEAFTLAEKICQRVAQEDFDKVGKVSVSVGVVDYQADEGLDSWVLGAEYALQKAKEQGGGCVAGVDDRAGNVSGSAVEEA